MQDVIEQLIKREEALLKFWKEHRIFEKTLERNSKAKRFVFYEGPPSANAPPGFHHVLSRVYKDLFCRFKAMCGYFVLRKAGWDTHGLPVEVQVEKELGLKNKKEIEKYGIARFNAKCRQSVWRYKEEWEKLTRRIGFWIDTADPYVTYDADYIESEWWLIKQIAGQKLLYEDYKVVPYCSRCGTPLSSHEVAQGYKTVKDPGVFVAFAVAQDVKAESLKLEAGARFLVWTTTPWTLPTNTALAVGSGISYVLVKQGSASYILAKDRLDVLEGGYETVSEFTGAKLAGLAYEPPFSFFKPEAKERAHTVFTADFVSTEEGTGIVHISPAFGEDDLAFGRKHKLPVWVSVDTEGKFIGAVAPWASMFVKDADAGIIEELAGRGILYKSEPYEHEYPFCWRCDTPLLYYAKNSWFINMQKAKYALMRNNAQINWVPEHLRDGRFGQWLKELKDWAFSRERYWGTPLPVWRCKECGHDEVAGSLADLERKRFRAPNTYILLRHGEAGTNKKGIVSSDPISQDTLHSLTKEGRAQVEAAARSFGKRKKKIDVVYASDFARTKQTADIVAEPLGLQVRTDVRLRELKMGVLEGKPVGLYHEQFKSPMERFTKRVEAGESWRDVKKRVMNFIVEVDRLHEGKNILIVAHEVPLHLLLCGALGLGEEASAAAGNDTYFELAEAKQASFKNYPYNAEGDLDLHRPFVDEVSLRCSKCKGEARRVPDVVDVWFDSGAMPFAQWHWPFEHRNTVGASILAIRRGSQFPADFIAEGIDQTRGWFYSLLAVSTLIGKGPAYKNVISLAHILDKQGQKMSKSKGNVVNPWDMIDKYGMDAMRWYLVSVNGAEDPKRFDESDVLGKLRGFVLTAVNSMSFLKVYARLAHERKTGQTPLRRMQPTPLDRWVISRLNTTARIVRESLDRFDATAAARALEDFMVNDLSKWYIRRSRDRAQEVESPSGVRAVGSTLCYVMAKFAVLAAPMVPFLAEHLYQEAGRLEREGHFVPVGKHVRRTESVHLEAYPEFDPNEADERLEDRMDTVRKLAALALKLRTEKKLKVRQPLSLLTFVAPMPIEKEVLALLADEVNVKAVEQVEAISEAAEFIAEEGEVKVFLATSLTPALREEGFVRELVRQIQEMRKFVNLELTDPIALQLAADESTRRLIGGHQDYLKERTATAQLELANQLGGVFDIEKEFELEAADGKPVKIKVGLRKLK